LANAKVLYGSVHRANMDLLAPTDTKGQTVLGFSTLDKTPYIEMGYAIDNIFKVLRIDAIHRFTYRQSPGSTPFSLKFSFWFNI